MAELYLRAQMTVARAYRQPLTLHALARTLAVSPRQLERAYDEIGLTTFAAHLRAVRLRNAADLLAHQPLTVTDVARLVGYRQPSHFVKAFRRRFGMTPGAFRDAARRRAAHGAAAGRALPRSSSAHPPAQTPQSGDHSAGAHLDARLPRPPHGVRAGARVYSKPNSDPALPPDPNEGFVDGERPDDGVVPAPAARAESADRNGDADCEPAPPPEPSKPNSALA
jgi:AraC-like DNA-binding protein